MTSLGSLARLRWQLHQLACRKRPEAVAYPTRRHPGQSTRRVLILSYDNGICRSQIYPFYFYRQQLEQAYDVAFLEQDVDRSALDPSGSLQPADIVIVQPWFTVGDDGLNQLLETIRTKCRPRRIVFLDCYAPTDLRFARTLTDQVDVYVKKHVLRDRARYGRPTVGDTNLTDYIGRRHKLDLPETLFEVPDAFWGKLLVGPSFSTADYMLGGFLGDRPRRGSEKYDIHARLGSQGTEFYEALRGDAVRALERIQGISALTEFPVPKRRYLRELSHSRLCFSPFGYGEVAWRDYEAVLFGSLLVKQDSSHLETDPDIFASADSYVPVRWDFSDLEEKVRYFLDNSGERLQRAQNAFDILSTYMKSERFVQQMAPVFGG